VFKELIPWASPPELAVTTYPKAEASNTCGRVSATPKAITAPTTAQAAMRTACRIVMRRKSETVIE
jgi:hypothetical protein